MGLCRLVEQTLKESAKLSHSSWIMPGGNIADDALFVDDDKAWQLLHVIGGRGSHGGVGERWVLDTEATGPSGYVFGWFGGDSENFQAVGGESAMPIVDVV